MLLGVSDAEREFPETPDYDVTVRFQSSDERPSNIV